ncbi:MAG: porin [Rhizobiaceae bacterium]
MNLKRLLLGTAAALSAASAADAADAIVMAVPEPMEYVRICDVYGSGFFYIPGTETCMKIGGYYRFETRFDFTGGTMDWWNRFALGVDVRSETEWGTLRGYTDTYFDYGWGTYAGVVAGAPATISGYRSIIDPEAMFIELITASGTLRLGKADAPYSRFLGWGGLNIIDAGVYSYYNSTEISFTFTGSNGFSAIIALVEDADRDYVPNIEGGILLSQGWGSAGLIAGYDEATGTFGLKGALTVAAPNGSASFKLMPMYASGTAGGVYDITSPTGTNVNFSVLGSVAGALTPKVGAALTTQWFSDSAWLFQGELQFTPVEDFLIVPSVTYTTPAGGSWTGLIRFQRTIPPA